MMNGDSPIVTLLKQPVAWLTERAPGDDIAISSRIRVARNLRNYPFPIAADGVCRASVIDTVREAVDAATLFDPGFTFTVPDLSETEKQVLLERRLVSYDFITASEGTALFLLADESMSMMVNEEDHIRIQAMRPGFDLDNCKLKVFAAERALDKHLPFAFDQKYGYLTSCPTNVGTGMRVSVMLHLPALVMTDQIAAIERSAAKLGLTVRGFMGEGSENMGNLFQISNQSTLGESEDKIVDRLETVIRQVIAHEQTLRQRMREDRGPYLMNQIGRALGVLKHAYILSTKEAIGALSSLRLGVDLGILDTAPLAMINDMFMNAHPAHLQQLSKEPLTPEGRDIFRAELFRERLKEV